METVSRELEQVTRSAFDSARPRRPPFTRMRRGKLRRDSYSLRRAEIGQRVSPAVASSDGDSERQGQLGDQFVGYTAPGLGRSLNTPLSSRSGCLSAVDGFVSNSGLPVLFLRFSLSQKGFGVSSTGIEIVQLICRWWETFNRGLLVLLLGFSNFVRIWILIRGDRG